MKTVEIESGVTSIGKHAFYDCSALTSVTIPDSVTCIGEYAFCYCVTLTDVYYTGTKEQWNAILFGSANYALNNANIHFSYRGSDSAH